MASSSCTTQHAGARKSAEIRSSDLGDGGSAVEEAGPMEPLTAHKQASQVAAEGGNVIIDGPDGVAITMSPDAAEETGKRLVQAAGEARRQAGPHEAQRQ
jgi:hypothetical protein